MKRELKFRGISTKTGRFIYGDLINNPEFETTVAIGLFDNQPGNGIDTPPYHSYDLFEVKSDTIGQFTGLNDKNGKEIYECDILKDKYSDLYIVHFKNGAFVYKSITEKLDLFYNLSNSNIECEIVGNIYENSDLLS